MRAMSKVLALVLIAALRPAMADVTLDFEDITAQDDPVKWITDRYASNHVTFTGYALGARSGANGCGGQANFSGTDTNNCGAVELSTFTDPPSLTNVSFDMSLDVDFSGFSFAYSALNGPSVNIVVKDAAGKVLSSLVGLDNTLCQTGGLQYCDWRVRTISWSGGLGRSVSVSSSDQQLMLDNLRFVSPAANNDLPEPASMALALGALGAVGLTRRRSRA